MRAFCFASAGGGAPLNLSVRRHLMRLQRLFVLPFMLALPAIGAGSASAQFADQSLPPGLQSAIQRIAVGASIVPPRDFGQVSCNPLSQSPALVVADFNGDGYVMPSRYRRAVVMAVA